MSHKGLAFTLAWALAIPVLGAPATSLAKSSSARASGGKQKKAKKKSSAPAKHGALAAAPSKAKPAKAAAPHTAVTPLLPTSKSVSAPPKSLDSAPRVVHTRPPVEHPPSADEVALGAAVGLDVTPAGPHGTWEARVSNRGARAVLIATDARLLWFEATVPGRKAPVQCRLPASMLPRKLELARPRLLGAGETFSFRVDPRMYCYEKGEQLTLVPGTFLRPHYGWPELTAASWSGGSKHAVRLAQSLPFVAHLRPATEEATASEPVAGPATAPASSSAPDESDEEDDEATDVTEPEDAAGFVDTELDDSASTPRIVPGPAPRADVNRAPTHEVRRRVGNLRASDLSEPGIKQVTGDGFALDSTYIGWTRARHHAAPDHADDAETRHERPFSLEVTYASDALTPRDVNVTVTLKNLTNEAKRAYFRRDLLSFSVVGPEGEQACDVDDTFRSPERLGSVNIPAHKSESLTTRLIENCPEDVFSRPGFYYVSVKLNTDLLDDTPGDSAFHGSLASEYPRPVRVQTAELPFRARRRPTFSNGAAAPAAEPGQPPAIIQQQVQPAQPAPAEAQPVPPPPPGG